MEGRVGIFVLSKVLEDGIMSPSGKWQVGLLLSIIKSEYLRCKEKTCLLPIVSDSGTLSSDFLWYHATHLFDGPVHIQFSCSVMSNSATPWSTAHQASLSITNSKRLLKLISIESVMPSNHLILCCPLLLLSSIFPSIRVFSNESALRIRWPLYRSFSFNISPSNEHSGLISFRMDWLDLLAVQETLKSLLQRHSSKASILEHLSFFILQLLHPYMSTGKTIALTRRSFVDTPTTLFLHSLLNTIPLYKTLVTFFPPLLLSPFYTFCFMHTALLSPLYASISLEFSTRLLCTEWIVSGFNSNDILMRSCSFTLQSNEVTLPCPSLFRMSFWILSFFFFFSSFFFIFLILFYF